MRWSRLKKLLQEIFDPELNLEVFCTVQRGEHGSIGRYWFVLDGKTIWDEPQNVSATLRAGELDNAASEIGAIIRHYLELPKEELLTAKFSGDRWGVTEVLKAADRRIGKRRLPELLADVTNLAAEKLIKTRLKA